MWIWPEVGDKAGPGVEEGLGDHSEVEELLELLVTEGHLICMLDHHLTLLPRQAQNKWISF